MLLSALAAIYPEKLNAVNATVIAAAIVFGIILHVIGRRKPTRRLLIQLGLILVVVGVALFAWLCVPRNL